MFLVSLCILIGDRRYALRLSERAIFQCQVCTLEWETIVDLLSSEKKYMNKTKEVNAKVCLHFWRCHICFRHELSTLNILVVFLCVNLVLSKFSVEAT